MDVVELVRSALFGAVEGATEWLPVSSTAHMLLLFYFFTPRAPLAVWRALLAAMQLGAVAAVCRMRFGRLNPWARDKGPQRRRATLLLWLRVGAASVPGLVTGALLDGTASYGLGSPLVIAGGLVVMGVLLVVIETTREDRADKAAASARQDGGATPPPSGRHMAAPADSPAKRAEAASRIRRVIDVDMRTMLIVGLFHACAPVAGTSRMAPTLVGALLLGCSRTVAFELALCLSIPTMIVANVGKVTSFLLAAESTPLWTLMLALGFAAAYAASRLAVTLFSGYVRRNSLKPFGWYRIALGVAIIMCVIALW